MCCFTIQLETQSSNGTAPGKQSIEYLWTNDGQRYCGSRLEMWLQS